MQFFKGWLLIASAACLVQALAQQQNGYNAWGNAQPSAVNNNNNNGPGAGNGGNDDGPGAGNGNNNQQSSGWGQHRHGQDSNQNNTVTVTMMLTVTEQPLAQAIQTMTVTVTAVQACGSSVVSDYTSSTTAIVSAAAISSPQATLREFTTTTDANFVIGVVTSIPVSVAATLGKGSGPSPPPVSPGTFVTMSIMAASSSAPSQPVPPPAPGPSAPSSSSTVAALGATSPVGVFAGTTLTTDAVLMPGPTSIPVGESKQSV